MSRRLYALLGLVVSGALVGAIWLSAGTRASAAGAALQQPGVSDAHGAVIATRPARQPLIDMPRSGLPSHIQLSDVADSNPMNAAVFVVANT